MAGGEVTVQMGRVDDQSAAQLAAILRSSADAIVTITANGVVLSWSAGAEAMFGHAAADAIGKPIKDLIFSPSARANYRQFDPARSPA